MSHYERPIDHAEDEADCLRDWRRDVSAEAALPLPGLETGPDTLFPDTLEPQGCDKRGMAATACEGTAPKDETGKCVREPAASTIVVDTSSRHNLRPEEPGRCDDEAAQNQQTRPSNQQDQDHAKHKSSIRWRLS